MQLGSSDQWGNVTSGIELPRRGREVQEFGLTMPLVTKADSTKFGKTKGNAVWLDAEKTSPYEFYRFWINTDDRDAVKFLKYSTFLTLDEIATTEEEFTANPDQRATQKALAKEVITLVHGETAYHQAVKISEALFNGDIQSLTAKEIKQGFKDVPTYGAQPEDQLSLVDLLVTSKIEPSRRQACKGVQNGVIYVNGERRQGLAAELTETDKTEGQLTVIHRGKKKYSLLKY